MKNGFFSGYFPALTGPSNMSFALTINDTAPIWYYCSQGPHCTSGQVGVINPYGIPCDSEGLELTR